MTIITNDWIDSKDLAEEGNLILNGLKMEVMKLKIRINKIEELYADLMRTINKEEQEQIDAKKIAQDEIYLLYSDLNNFKDIVAQVMDQINNNYSTKIGVLLSDYTPPEPEPEPEV